MSRILVVSAIALLAGVGVAAAQTAVAPAPNAAIKMSAAQCEGLWTQADHANVGSLTASQAQPFISDFKSANTSGSGTLTKVEFLAACAKGMAHGSSTTGASTGTSGSAVKK